MEKITETLYYHVSPELIVNTLILSPDDFKDMQIAARQVKGVSISPVPENNATDAYVQAAHERKSEEATIRYSVVSAAVGRVLDRGGKVARIIVENKRGHAERQLTSFEQRVVSEAYRRRQRNRRRS